MLIKEIDLNKLSDLNIDELNNLKIEIINSCDLLSIPSVLLPDVFYDDYFFISYSHKDYRLVYTDIINLQRHNLNTWYDRGIPGGKNWKDIANKYMSPINCVGVLFYISENALLSQAVIDEIEYALKLNKPVICINLPFENDYQYKNQSTLGKVYSTKEMLEILKNQYEIDENKEKTINALLNEEKIFLPYDMHVVTKVEKIKGNIKEIPTLRYEIDEHNSLDIKGANDINALKLTKDDFPCGTSNVFISSCAFANMIYLESVDFSNYVFIQDIGPYAFSSCLMLKDIINQSAILSLDNGVFAGCSSLESIDLPNIRLLESFVFADCTNLRSISLGDHCCYIGERCFANCSSLCEVKLPKSIETISSYAFSECSSLKHIDLPESTDEIQDNAFARSGLESIIIPNNINNIESYLFEKCESLKEVALPSKLKEIKDHAFVDCLSLKTIDLPNTLISIEESAFEGCGIEKIIIPNSITTLSDNLFFECNSLKEVVLPPSIKEIGSKVFKNCISLSSITLPNSVLKIGGNAFCGCTSLISVNIPPSVTIISEGLFYGCTNLKEIKLSNNIRAIKSHAFRESGLEKIIYDGTKDEFNQIALEKKCFFNNKNIMILCLDGEIRYGY